MLKKSFFFVLVFLFDNAFAQTIKVAWESAPRTIDPRFSNDANSQYLEDLIHCSLFTFSESGQIINELVQDWQWIDHQSLKITIKSGVVFSDGAVLRIEDVIETYKAFLNPSILSPRAFAFAEVNEVKKIGDNSLVFVLKKPNAAFLANLVVGVLPEKYAQRVRALQPEDNVPGCGFFRLKSMDQGQITLQKNPNYQLGKLATVDQVIIKITKDETTAYAKFLNKELDIIQGLINKDKLVTLKDKANIRIARRPGLNMSYLAFNLKDRLLKEKPLRQAIACAINKEAIIKFILRDYAQVAHGFFGPEHEYFAKDVKFCTYDFKKAQSNLEIFKRSQTAANVLAGDIKLRFSTTTAMSRVAIAKAISADLKKIGISVAYESLEWGRFKNSVDSGAIPMWTLTWIGFKDPDILRFSLASASFPPSGGNRGFFSNQKFDELTDAAKSVYPLEKRLSFYNEAQMIIASEIPIVPLWHEDVVAVYRDNIRPIKLYADGRYRWLAKLEKEGKP